MKMKCPSLLVFLPLASALPIFWSGCASAPAGGSDAPAATLSGEWVQIWGDEFEVDGAPDPTRWSYAVGGHGWGNKELQFYTDNRRENAVVEDGVLRIIARRENYEGNEYTSARVISRGKGDFQYGRFVVRARLPDGVGTWPAFWLMPSDWDFSDGGWPDIGEIDVIEHVGYDPGVIHASAHSRDYQWQKGTQKTGVVTVPTVTTEFHEYVLEWTPDLIEVSIDGNPFFTYENEGLGPTKWPYDKPFYLIFNIAVGGEWGSVKGIDADAFPQVFEIDYVRVYQRAEPR